MRLVTQSASDIRDPLFSFPPHYDKVHTVCSTLPVDDLEYQLRQIQQKREDEGKRS